MECKRCGKCCLYEINNTEKSCRYLIYNGKFTTCSIYENRIGTIIDKEILIKNYIQGKDLVKNIVCGYRKDQNKYIEECTIGGQI